MALRQAGHVTPLARTMWASDDGWDQLTCSYSLRRLRVDTTAASMLESTVSPSSSFGSCSRYPTYQIETYGRGDSRDLSARLECLQNTRSGSRQVPEATNRHECRSSVKQRSSRKLRVCFSAKKLAGGRTTTLPVSGIWFGLSKRCLVSDMHSRRR